MRYRFVQDVRVEGTLQVVTVRSQRASATLVGVDFPDLPEDVIVVRAADIPGAPHLVWGGRKMPLLAQGTVRYVGEPVALVAARDLAVAQAAAADVSIRYGSREVDSVDPGDAESPPLRLSLSTGEGTAATERSSLQSEVVTLPRRFAPPSPQEAVALWDGGVLVVRTATQDPFHVRDTVAAALGLAAARVRVIGEPLEGPGGKLLTPSLVSAHAAIVSQLASAPARVRYSWREELGVAFRIPGTRSSSTFAMGSEGKILAARYHLTIEGGAFDPMAAVQVERAGRALGSLYRYGGLSIEVVHESAGAVPCELPPGCGELEGTLVRELSVSAAARASGSDPAEWRLEHLEARAAENQLSARRARGRTVGAAVEVLREAMRLSGFSRKYAAWEAVRERREARPDAGMPMRGIGIALASFTPGLSPAAERGSRVRISMAKDRKVTVSTSIVNSGRGWHRLFAEIVGLELGIPASQVSVSPVDTATVPWSGPTVASRTAPLIVPLLRTCCASLKSRLRRSGPPCSAESSHRAASDPESLESYAATVAGVEVEKATGVLRSTGVWSVIDAGEVLDPLGSRAAALAALVRGLGVATLEASEAAVVPVPPVSGAFATPPPTYRIAALGDVGPLEVAFLDHRSGRPKAVSSGISELALLGVAPAVASAVAQATGRTVTRIPILAEDLAPAPGALT